MLYKVNKYVEKFTKAGMWCGLCVVYHAWKIVNISVMKGKWSHAEGNGNKYIKTTRNSEKIWGCIRRKGKRNK